MVSYQAQSPVLAAVLPSNSPGVHTLWLPVIALQMGLVLKPGPQEPWTPYRIFAAFTEAGVPREAFSLYPGEAEAGAAVLEACDRAMIFGGTATVERYRGNPKVQAHGPGFSKILLGDDVVDRWPEYLDLMADSIYLNSGRGCINCSGVWASRHTAKSPRRSPSGSARSKHCRRPIRKPASPRSRCPAWAPPFGSRSNKTCKRPASRTPPKSMARGSSNKSGPATCGRRSFTHRRPMLRSLKKNTCSHSRRSSTARRRRC